MVISGGLRLFMIQDNQFIDFENIQEICTKPCSAPKKNNKNVCFTAKFDLIMMANENS